MKVERTRKKSASGIELYRERSFSEGDKNIREFEDYLDIIAFL